MKNGIKNLLKQGILVLVLPLMAFTIAHKFYISVTNVGYSETDDALQITTRIFIDDFEDLLQKRYGFKAKLDTDKELELTDEYIEKYLSTKFVVTINGEVKKFDFLGKEYEDDIMICYLEITNIDFPSIKTIALTNEILMDLFDDQKNLVHFKIKGKKTSFVLIKENNKGMLNL
ncbi:DUF6702 family protein [uncultured Kriegella sp.]|uniref:DUF6702 family protein n=1 Tax=uncultured Kriegella sp. TaxID=1798910 RepID=UPI0030D75AB4